MRIFKEKCEEIRKKIPALIDEELTDVEKNQLKEHLDACNSCSEEFNMYLERDKILKRLDDIEPSLHFNGKLFDRIRQPDVKVTNPVDMFLKWILPVPALCAAVLAIFIGFTLISPYIYAMPEQNNTMSVPVNAKKSLLSFMDFSSYCDMHCQQVCRFCQATKGSKCICGRCDDESKK
ncbi:MAG: hypothetical protein A2452_06685 [Candidatus Firestonebacteria bacterium RIFOXYC2_FULL_39_67]|nr:MAG: hypothetical protein A2452_06685 [Candidatus Firestonebacteria bacterium RIFOXYC2_FULL_39_67]